MDGAGAKTGPQEEGGSSSTWHLMCNQFITPDGGEPVYGGHLQNNSWGLDINQQTHATMLSYYIKNFLVNSEVNISRHFWW